MSWEQAGLVLFTVSIPLEIGHTFSPIILAWSHNGLRRIVLRDPARFLGWPILATALIYALSPEKAFGVYSAWNIFHFGMQHFGVLSLFKRQRNADARFRAALLCVLGTVVGMVVVPLFLPRWAALSVTYLFGFSHWITDLSLSAFVSARWWLFLGVALGLGCLGFTLMIPRADHTASYVIPWLIRARWSLGMIHFIYSARIWKMSDPQVRAIIGRDLFGQPAAA